MFRDSNSMVTFAVKVVARASKNQIAGIQGDAVKIRLNAPPVEGKANSALIAFLADTLGVRGADIEIIAGHTSRHKIVRVRGLRAHEVERKLMQK